MRLFRHKFHKIAADAYQRHCEEKGIVHRVPSSPLTAVGWKWVTLRDNNGILAKYNIWTKEVIDNTGE